MSAQSVFGALADEKKPTRMLVFKMVPLVGFELTTYRLQGECSTN